MFTSVPSLHLSSQLTKHADFLKFLAFSPTIYPFSGWVCCNGFLLLLAAVRLGLLDSGLGANSRSSVWSHLCPNFCPHSVVLSYPSSMPASFLAGIAPLTGATPSLMSFYGFLPIIWTTERLAVFLTTHALFASWIHSCKKYLVNYMLSARLEVSWWTECLHKVTV